MLTCWHHVKGTEFPLSTSVFDANMNLMMIMIMMTMTSLDFILWLESDVSNLPEKSCIWEMQLFFFSAQMELPKRFSARFKEWELKRKRESKQRALLLNHLKQHEECNIIENACCYFTFPMNEIRFYSWEKTMPRTIEQQVIMFRVSCSCTIRGQIDVIKILLALSWRNG